jgi:hypothetical protein
MWPIDVDEKLRDGEVSKGQLNSHGQKKARRCRESNGGVVVRRC